MLSDNQQIANCFRAALKILWDGKDRWAKDRERYICHALWEAAKKNNLPGESMAKDVIYDRLQGSFTVEGWLRKQGVETYDNIVAIQAWRKQWLEQLIEEFENK